MEDGWFVIPSPVPEVVVPPTHQPGAALPTAVVEHVLVSPDADARPDVLPTFPIQPK